MYASLHGVSDPATGEEFYPGTAMALQEEPLLVNVPLPRGTTSQAYLRAFARHVTPAVRRFAPNLIIISCGFDAAAGDSPAHEGGYLNLDPCAAPERTAHRTLQWSPSPMPPPRPPTALLCEARSVARRRFRSVARRRFRSVAW